MTEDTMVPLREYIEMRFAAIEKSILYEHDAGKERDLAYKTQSELVANSIQIQFSTVEKATALAATAVEKRLEGMNEFRQQLNDQTSRLMTRAEYEGKHESIEKRITFLEKTAANFEGRLWAVGGSIGVISIIVSIGLHYLR